MLRGDGRDHRFQLHELVRDVQRQDAVVGQPVQVQPHRLDGEQVDGDRVRAERVEQQQRVLVVRLLQLEARVAHAEVEIGPALPSVRHVAEVLVRVGDELLHRRVDLVEGELLPLVRVARYAPGAEADHRHVFPILAAAAQFGEHRPDRPRAVVVRQRLLARVVRLLRGTDREVVPTVGYGKQLETVPRVPFLFRDLRAVQCGPVDQLAELQLVEQDRFAVGVPNGDRVLSVRSIEEVHFVARRLLDLQDAEEAALGVNALARFGVDFRRPEDGGHAQREPQRPVHEEEAHHHRQCERDDDVDGGLAHLPGHRLRRLGEHVVVPLEVARHLPQLPERQPDQHGDDDVQHQRDAAPQLGLRGRGRVGSWGRAVRLVPTGEQLRHHEARDDERERELVGVPEHQRGDERVEDAAQHAAE